MTTWIKCIKKKKRSNNQQRVKLILPTFFFIFIYSFIDSYIVTTANEYNVD